MLGKVYEKIMSLDALLSMISGVLMALAFPTIGFSSLAFISILPLLFTLFRTQRKIPSILCGIIAGFVFYLGTVYWVTLTMENYGGVPRVLSLFILMLFSLYLSLYFGLFAWGVVHIQRSRIPVWVGAPFLWVALEYARGHILTGFPWALLGYTQFRNLSLIQISDLTGVYGVSFIVILINVIFFKIILIARDRQPLRQMMAPLASLLMVLVLTVTYGLYRIDQLRVVTPSKRVKVGIVQGNIDQDIKWDPQYRDKILAVHTHLSRRAAQEEPDLIVWPEASAPFYFMADKDYQARLIALIDDLGSDLLFGSPDYTMGDGGGQFFNSAFLVSPDAKLRGKYDKLHLVPFGEYVPLRRFLFFVQPIIEQIGDITPGHQITLMHTRKGKCGTPICFEIIFPDLVRRFVREGAVFIATLTNDNWFGRSSAPYQHFSMAVFRAVENHVPVVRSANSGISGVIAADGKIVTQTDLFVEDVVMETLNLRESPPTFYTRFGDLFSFLCLAVSVVMILDSWFFKKRTR